MGKPVAVEGDVQATASKDIGKKKAAADTEEKGSWAKKGDVTYTSYTHLTIDGKKVIYQASCKFSYSGGKTKLPNGTVVPTKPPDPEETVTLTATQKVLQSSLSAVLVDGDEMKSDDGNSLKVSASSSVATS